VTEPRRVLIAWDYGAGGIWWVLTREEKQAPAPAGRWSGTPPRRSGEQRSGERPRPWSDRLSAGLLDDLQRWNDDWDHAGIDPVALQERGRDLAIRVQDELGTGDWEVLYQLGDRMLRVHPPGSWPIGSWQQELLGYAPPRHEHPGR
jgi:hypothetical protein